MDDVLIFLNGRKSLVDWCVDFLEEYCLVSRQAINASKCSFTLGRKVPLSRAVTICNIMGYTQADPNVPFEYLGVPLF